LLDLYSNKNIQKWQKLNTGRLVLGDPFVVVNSENKSDEIIQKLNQV